MLSTSTRALLFVFGVTTFSVLTGLTLSSFKSRPAVSTVVAVSSPNRWASFPPPPPISVDQPSPYQQYPEFAPIPPFPGQGSGPAASGPTAPPAASGPTAPPAASGPTAPPAASGPTAPKASSVLPPPKAEAYVPYPSKPLPTPPGWEPVAPSPSTVYTPFAFGAEINGPLPGFFLHNDTKPPTSYLIHEPVQPPYSPSDLPRPVLPRPAPWGQYGGVSSTFVSLGNDPDAAVAAASKTNRVLRVAFMATGFLQGCEDAIAKSWAAALRPGGKAWSGYNAASGVPKASATDSLFKRLGNDTNDAYIARLRAARPSLADLLHWEAIDVFVAATGSHARFRTLVEHPDLVRTRLIASAELVIFNDEYRKLMMLHRQKMFQFMLDKGIEKFYNVSINPPSKDIRYPGAWVLLTWMSYSQMYYTMYRAVMLRRAFEKRNNVVYDVIVRYRVDHFMPGWAGVPSSFVYPFVGVAPNSVGQNVDVPRQLYYGPGNGRYVADAPMWMQRMFAAFGSDNAFTARPAVIDELIELYWNGPLEDIVGRKINDEYPCYFVRHCWMVEWWVTHVPTYRNITTHTFAPVPAFRDTRSNLVRGSNFVIFKMPKGKKECPKTPDLADSRVFVPFPF